MKVQAARRALREFEFCVISTPVGTEISSRESEAGVTEAERTE